MVTHAIGKMLVWIHIDDETGQRVNDFVRIMKAPRVNAKSFGAREQYQVQVLRTGEPALAFSDELREWEK